jgi:hypothetical protein
LCVWSLQTVPLRPSPPATRPGTGAALLQCVGRNCVRRGSMRKDCGTGHYWHGPLRALAPEERVQGLRYGPLNERSTAAKRSADGRAVQRVPVPGGPQPGWAGGGGSGPREQLTARTPAAAPVDATAAAGTCAIPRAGKDFLIFARLQTRRNPIPYHTQRFVLRV